MTRTAVLSIVLLLATLLLPARAPAQTEIRNGDVNGSGALDLSDVIYLAGYLFRGGTPPVNIVCPAPSCEPPEPACEFDGQYYKSLNLEQAAREQFGLTASLESTGDHLYDWKVRVGRELHGLDLTRAVTQQYGPDYTLVAVGVHRFDWKAFRILQPNYVVLPVMLVASDRFLDIAGVATAVGRFRSVLGRVCGWYEKRVEGTLQVLQPIILPTGLSSAQWNALSASTAQEATRYALLDQCINTCEAGLPDIPADMRVVVSIYTGDSSQVWLGAASAGKYAMAPPRATSLQCPATGPLDVFCADAAYAIGHELGHTLGLAHTCDEFPEHPRCSRSIMQVGRPPDAILLQPEICTLFESGFFEPLGGGDPGRGPIPIDWR